MKIIFGFVLVSAISSFWACQRTVSSAPVQKFHEEGKNMSSTNHEITDGSEVLFILNEQKIVPSPKTLPQSFYIKGVWENNSFKATSKVLGTGSLASQGRYGWLELQSKKFFPMESDQRAQTPFVKGYITDQGFVPSERDVIDTP